MRNKSDVTLAKDYARSNEWAKNNMACVSAKYKKEFVDEFSAACTKLGLKKSDVFRQAMIDVIEKAKD